MSSCLNWNSYKAYKSWPNVKSVLWNQYTQQYFRLVYSEFCRSNRLWVRLWWNLKNIFWFRWCLTFWKRLLSEPRSTLRLSERDSFPSPSPVLRSKDFTLDPGKLYIVHRFSIHIFFICIWKVFCSVWPARFLRRYFFNMIKTFKSRASAHDYNVWMGST